MNNYVILCIAALTMGGLSCFATKNSKPLQAVCHLLFWVGVGYFFLRR